MAHRNLYLAASMMVLSAAALTARAELAPEWLTPERAEWPTYFAVDPIATPKKPTPKIDLREGVKISATWVGSAAGITAGKISLDGTFSPTGYQMNYGLRQPAIAFISSESQNDSTAAGLNDNGKLTTLLYTVDEFEKGDDYRKVELFRANAADRYSLWSEPAYKLVHPVRPADAKDTVDPVTGFVMLGFAQQAPGAEPCDRTIKIYDGKRRFNFHLRPAGYYEINNRREGRYSGGAWRCSIDKEFIAGYNDRAMEEPVKSDGYVYLAVVPEAVRSPALTYFPVLMEGSFGIIKSKVEVRDPVFIAADGTKVTF